MRIPISFEFFPPKTPAAESLLREVQTRLQTVKPEFYSVTYGAGGTTQAGTLATVRHLLDQGLDAAPHLSCVGASFASIRELLAEIRMMGVRRIIALRGDLPSGMQGLGDFRYASDLVRFIREEHGDHFDIIVAAYPETHPQARSPEDDLNALLIKAQAGAKTAITQYFFNSDAYFHLVDRVNARGSTMTIIPGIMPITNFSQLARFSDGCGAEIPRWIRLQLQSYGDDRASIQAFGLDVVSWLCEQLVHGGAPALHFYTMNRAEPSLAILERVMPH